MEPSWHALGPEPARVGPAPGQYRKALHTNVCSAPRASPLILGIVPTPLPEPCDWEWLAITVVRSLLHLSDIWLY